MHAILAVIWSWDGQWSWATKAPLNCQALAFNASSLSCHGGSSVGISMEVGRWSSRPSLMTPKPARKGRDRSWLLQLVPNQVQLSRWRSKSAAHVGASPQEIISRSSRTSRRRRLCDGLRDEVVVVRSLSRHVGDHGLRASCDFVFGLRQGLEVGDRRARPRHSHRSFSVLPSLVMPIKHSGLNTRLGKGSHWA